MGTKKVHRQKMSKQITIKTWKSYYIDISRKGNYPKSSTEIGKAIELGTGMPSEHR
jgi:hypothetical protein